MGQKESFSDGYHRARSGLGKGGIFETKDEKQARTRGYQDGIRDSVRESYTNINNVDNGTFVTVKNAWTFGKFIGLFFGIFLPAQIFIIPIGLVAGWIFGAATVGLFIFEMPIILFCLFLLGGDDVDWRS